MQDKKEILDNIDWIGWLYNPGVPPNKPTFEEELVQECRDLANVWGNASDEEIANIDVEQFNKMTSVHKSKCWIASKRCHHSHINVWKSFKKNTG